MKTMQYPVLSIIALVFSAWFSGCGEDPENGSTTPKNGNEISPIIPEAKIKLPGSKWVGTREEFEVIFEERDSPSNGNLVTKDFSCEPTTVHTRDRSLEFT
jgi:hypothetical protein